MESTTQNESQDASQLYYLLGYESTDPLTREQVEALARSLPKENVGVLIDRVTGFRWSTYDYYYPMLQLIFSIAKEREADLSKWVKSDISYSIDDLKENDLIDLFKALINCGVKLDAMGNLPIRCLNNYRFQATLFLLDEKQFQFSDEILVAILRYRYVDRTARLYDEYVYGKGQTGEETPRSTHGL